MSIELTEQEKGLMRTRAEWPQSGMLFAAVERIIARRLAQAAADWSSRANLGLSASVLAALSEAWNEGCRATEQFYKRSVIGLPGMEPIAPPINPYRETP